MTIPTIFFLVAAAIFFGLGLVFAITVWRDDFMVPLTSGTAIALVFLLLAWAYEHDRRLETERAEYLAAQQEECRELCGLFVPIECGVITASSTHLSDRRYAICYSPGNGDPKDPDWSTWVELGDEKESGDGR